MFNGQRRAACPTVSTLPEGVTMTTSLRTIVVPAIVVLWVAASACGSGRSRVGSPDDQAVTSADLDRNPDKSIERVLQEKVSGVTVTRSNDGDIAVQIRGG